MFFKMVFGDFFDQFDKIENFEAVTNVIDQLQGTQKNAAEQLRDFFGEYANNTESENEGLVIFARNTTPDFFQRLASSTFFQTLEEKEIDSTRSGFWEEIFTGENTNEDTATIHAALQSVLDESNISESAVITALSSLSVEDFPVSEATEDA